MNYYELIYLKKELKNKLLNGVLEQAITPYKNMLELFINNDEKSCRLLFSTAPGNIALFSDPYRPGKKTNALQFFESLYGKVITDVVLPEKDRMLYIEFGSEYQLWFRLFSSKANALLVENGTVVKAFKEKDEIGKDAPNPKKQELFKELKDDSLNLKSKILRLNQTFPRAHLDELISYADLDNADNETITERVKLWTNQLREEPDPRLLKDGSVTLLSEQFLPVETEKKFDSANDLITFRYKNYSNQQRLKQQRSQIVKNIKRQIKRYNSALRNLNEADKGKERSAEYEKTGHILMANAYQKHHGKKKFEVFDFYDNKDIIITIDPELTIAENAEQYYQRSKKSLKSYEEALKRTPEIKEKKENLREILEKINSISSFWEWKDWVKDNTYIIDEFSNQTESKQETKLPFHTLTVGKYEVWIGKNAKSNDKLVQLGHKEDVWMHARGVPGSHLLIRMNNDKSMPESTIVREAASYAAFNSKVRGSKLVPVIVTKLKYVRKPKGAAAGAVLVQKEEVEMVTPKKPDNE